MLQQIQLAPVEVVGVDTQRHTRHRPPKRVTKVFLKTQQILFEHAGRLCYVNRRCMTGLPRGSPMGRLATSSVFARASSSDGTVSTCVAYS